MIKYEIRETDGWSAKPRADQDGFRDEVVIAARKLWTMKRSLRDREMPVDFNDIRTMFRLDGCPGIGRYDKVVVDESQDITPCDAAMISRIGAPVVYTGDDFQQLYSMFLVEHNDEHGEWWDADDDGFESIEDAERFLIETQSEQDSVEHEASRYAGE